MGTRCCSAGRLRRSRPDCASGQQIYCRHRSAALLGDAAFLARPHLAADAAKAAVNAITLAESLEVIRDDIEQALRFWEPAQLELGRELLAHGPIAAERLGLAKTEPVACAMPDGPPTSRDHDARQARHGEHETHLH